RRTRRPARGSARSRGGQRLVHIPCRGGYPRGRPPNPARGGFLGADFSAPAELVELLVAELAADRRVSVGGVVLALAQLDPPDLAGDGLRQVRELESPDPQVRRQVVTGEG